MTAPKILIASRNPGKQREMAAILADLPYRFVFPDGEGLGELPEEARVETADSFAGNARLKAEYFARRSRLPTLADDSGLEVLSLGGQPGVRSRRFAFPPQDEPAAQDRANNAELLRRLAGATGARRRARYRCAVAFLARPGGTPHIVEGACDGRILEAPRGKGGFGYDPLFHADDLDKSFGEATDDEKATVSHRGRALQAFADWLRAHPIG